MPSPRSSKAAAPKAPAVAHHTRAPFGFVFFFLLLAATFVFSTLYVISQAAREQALQTEAQQANAHLERRLDGLQTQVNALSAQVSLWQERLAATPTSTATTTRTR